MLSLAQVNDTTAPGADTNDTKAWALERKKELSGPSGTAEAGNSQDRATSTASTQGAASSVYEPDDQTTFGFNDTRVYTAALVNKGLLLAKMTLGTTSSPMNNSLNLLVDTGSSWTWAFACDKANSFYWETHNCPYFSSGNSSSLSESLGDKHIEYGSGSSSLDGDIREEQVRVFGSPDMEARLPILLS